MPESVKSDSDTYTPERGAMVGGAGGIVAANDPET